MEASVVDFGALIPGLQAGQFDMIAAGMFITPERAEQIIFSDPDYCVSNSFAVAEGNPLGISDFQSIIDSGATLASVGRSTRAMPSTPAFPRTRSSASPTWALSTTLSPPAVSTPSPGPSSP